jgi:hypothetical protein
MKKIMLLGMLFITQILSAQTAQTIKSGKWTDKSVWVGKKVPVTGAAITVNSGHVLTLDTTVEVGGLQIMKRGTLQFLTSRSNTLYSTENINVFGKLIMSPLLMSNIHTIVFKNVDESKFIGGGMDIFRTDVGLWVRDSGTVSLFGNDKTPYVYLKDSAVKGSNQIVLNRAPANWRAGDVIAISPTENNKQPNFYNGFDTRKIVSVVSNVVTLDSPIIYNHPRVYNPFKKVYLTSEVMNLTRNVRIEGTPTGRSHINIGMVNTPFTMKNVQIRYMGPRKPDGSGYTTKVTGRYALHLHMNGYATTGSYVKNVVVSDCGSHAYVPHASHGVLFENCISYNTFEEAYWWDFPTSDKDTTNNSHNTTYTGCIAAMTKCDPPFRGYRLTGFYLGSGRDNTAKRCIAVGNYGSGSASGFLWPEASNFTDNVWILDSNISHNNRCNGIFTWQNDSHTHIVKGFTIYNNGLYGLEHGAYVNAYKYTDLSLFGNKYGVFIHATPSGSINTVSDEWGYNAHIINSKSTDSLYITKHTLPGKGPFLFKDCYFPGVIVNELPPRVATQPAGLFDFVNCGLSEKSFLILGMEKGSLIRVQNGTTAFQIDSNGIITKIPPFFK